MSRRRRSHLVGADSMTAFPTNSLGPGVNYSYPNNNVGQSGGIGQLTEASHSTGILSVRNSLQDNFKRVSAGLVVSSIPVIRTLLMVRLPSPDPRPRWHPTIYSVILFASTVSPGGSRCQCFLAIWTSDTGISASGGAHQPFVARRIRNDNTRRPTWTGVDSEHQPGQLYTHWSWDPAC